MFTARRTLSGTGPVSVLTRWPGGRAAYRGPEIVYDRNGVPEWERDPEFPHDAFTFTRILYNAYGVAGGPSGGPTGRTAI
ncbi:MAG: hypothetical protein R3B90_02605 [Planctomycetaceae bacterium]